MDVSARKDQFSVAKYALLDDFPKVTIYLDSTIENEISVYSIKEWPLLKQYRESSEYKDFVERHKEQFKEEKYEPSNEIMENENDIALELENSFSCTGSEAEESD